jgi:imidazolonepropionase-like amidohydrolase
MRDATVNIQDALIVSIARDASSSSARRQGTADEVIDGKGLYLAPGLIDSHVHSSELPGLESSQAQAHTDMMRVVSEQVPVQTSVTVMPGPGLSDARSMTFQSDSRVIQ